MAIFLLEFLLIYVGQYVVFAWVVVWIFRSFLKKKYWRASLSVSVIITLFLVFFYQISTKVIVAEFGDVAYVKIPGQYKILKKETSYNTPWDMNLTMKIELSQCDVSKMINVIKEKKPETWRYIDAEQALLLYQDSKTDFRASLDLVGNIVTIEKKWSFF